MQASKKALTLDHRKHMSHAHLERLLPLAASCLIWLQGGQNLLAGRQFSCPGWPAHTVQPALSD
jgi:hypothetical protein